MSPTSNLVRLGLGVSAASVLVIGGLTSASSAASVHTPHPEVAQTSANGIALSWDAAGANAYRVRYSTSSSMAGSHTWDVPTNYFELTHTDANPSTSSPRLTPGKTYYFQVKAIGTGASASSRATLSSYSATVAATTGSGGTELTPVDLKATVGGADTMYVSWRTRGPGYDYVVRYSPDPDQPVLSWKSTTFDTNGGTISGLSPSTKYYVRVRVIDSSGTGQSDYSVPFSATTAATTSSPGIVVGSYNIRKNSGSPSWSSRRTAVAANILGQHPDVMALEEATPITVSGSTKQYQDILNLLNAGPTTYGYVTDANTSGTRLAYAKQRFTLVSAGSKALTTIGSATRYAVWATLQDKTSGKRFFVVATHLEPGSLTSSKYNDARIKQANQVLDIIHGQAGSLPVVVAGDMNSNRYSKPNNGQYRVFTGAGYVDPLDNATASWVSGAHATADHVLDGAYNSANGLKSTAPRTAYPIGTHIDYIYTSPAIKVDTWRMVLNLDTAGKFVGTIPSDHNMIVETLQLP